MALKNNHSFVGDTCDATYGAPVILDFTPVVPGMVGVTIGVNHKPLMHNAYNSVGLEVMSTAGGGCIESIWFMDYELAGSAVRYYQMTLWRSICMPLII